MAIKRCVLIRSRLAWGPSCCDRGERWKGSRTERSRASPVVVEKKTESRPSVTTACLSGAACLQLRWNQGEICAALIMSLVWIINESCSPRTRAPTEPINPPNTAYKHTHKTHALALYSDARERERNTLQNIHTSNYRAQIQMSNKHADTKIYRTTRLTHFIHTPKKNIQSQL